MDFSKTLKTLALMAMLALPVAATDINWTSLVTVIEGAAIVIGAVLVIILAVVPIMVTLALTNFITGLFASVLSSVERKI